MTIQTNPEVYNPSFYEDLGDYFRIDNLIVAKSQLTTQALATIKRNCAVVGDKPLGTNIPSDKTTAFWNGFSKNLLQHKDAM